MPKSSGSQKVMQTTLPPSFQVPYIAGPTPYPKNVPGVLPAAATAFQNGQLAPQPFPQSTVAPTSPITQQAWQAIVNRAQGSPLEGQFQNLLGDTINGKYLTAGNPNLDQVYQNVVAHVLPTVQATFTGSGREGSPLEAIDATDALAQAYAPIAAQSYDAERQRQMTAAGMVPTASALDYSNLAQLGNVGGQQQAQGQAELNDAVQRWMMQQGAPLTALQNYAGLVTGNFGSQSTSSQPLYTNPAAGALGGAATGAGIISGLGLSNSPWSFLGPLAGGLLGLI